MSPDQSATTAAASASLASLREILKPGDTLHGIQRHRSRSGKSRSISLVASANGELLDLDGHIARVLNLPFDHKHGGIRTDACGSELVYNLSRVLFPDEGSVALVFRRL